MNTSGLDRWSRLQNAPSLGMNTALTQDAYGGSTGSQVRRLSEDYNRASRLLGRQARKGNAQSALAAIKLREDAMDQGIQTGGIRKHDEYNAGILGRVQSMEQGAADRERAAQAQRQLADEALTPVTPVPGVAAPAAAAIPAPADRNTAALDILEGAKADDYDQIQNGVNSARTLGVKGPTSILQGDQNSLYRRTLDSSLGKAQTPEQIAALKARGTRYGIAPADFDRRANWWEKNRKA